MTTPKIVTPGELGTQILPFTSNANSLIDQAERAEIVDQASFDLSVDFIKICNTQLNRKEEIRKQLVDPLNQHVRWINRQFKPITDQIEHAKIIMNKKATTYQVAEQKRLEAEAEEERKRQEDLAIEQAEEAAERGDQETSEAILDVASETPNVPAKAKTGRGEHTGASGGLRGRWVGEVVDVKAVCQAIIDGKLSATVIREFSRTTLNEFAKGTQQEGLFCGVKVTLDQSLSVR